MWLLPEKNQYVFFHPFRCFIAGPTFSGKSKLIEKIVLNRDKIIDKKIEKIFICYKTPNNSYDLFKYMDIDVEMNEGLLDFNELDTKKNNLVILDDLMSVCKDSNEVLNLFTVDSHHRNISVFLVSQNLYTQGKCAREISLNASNLVIFKNPRDKTQVSILARQMFPQKTKAFLEAYYDCTLKEYGYIHLDLNPNTPENLRIQTNITESSRIIYTLN